MDWGIARYEVIAAQLEPAAEAVVAAARITPGDRVLDLGCGTGNAALRAARQGAVVTGVDPSPRLREVATKRAEAEGLSVTFAEGEGASIPLPDTSVDALLSVFAVVFASDPHSCAAEMARALAIDGRIVLSAWRPERALAEMGRVIGQARREALGLPDPEPPFPWHDADAVSALFAPHGLRTSTRPERIAFTAPSPQAYVDSELANHPRSREALDAIGGERAAGLRDELMSMLDGFNEDSQAFRVTSEYVIVTAGRALDGWS